MTLYFANAPREYGTLEDFVRLFQSLNGPAPKDAKFFSPPPGATGPAASDERRVGLLEWPDLQSAVEALILGNNHKIGTHTLRLSFTANSINNSDRRGGGGGGGSSSSSTRDSSPAPASATPATNSPLLASPPASAAPATLPPLSNSGSVESPSGTSASAPSEYSGAPVV